MKVPLRWLVENATGSLPFVITMDEPQKEATSTDHPSPTKPMTTSSEAPSDPPSSDVVGALADLLAGHARIKAAAGAVHATGIIPRGAIKPRYRPGAVRPFRAQTRSFSVPQLRRRRFFRRGGYRSYRRRVTFRRRRYY